MFHFNAIYLFATNPSWCLTSPHIPVISSATPLLLALGPPAGEALPATTHGGSKKKCPRKFVGSKAQNQKVWLSYVSNLCNRGF